MADSTSTSHTTSVATSINTKRKRKTRDATMYTKVKKAHEKGIRRPVTIDVATGRTYGENVEDFMGYIAL